MMHGYYVANGTRPSNFCHGFIYIRAPSV